MGLSKFDGVTPVLQMPGGPLDNDSAEVRANFIFVLKALFGVLFKSNDGTEQKTSMSNLLVASIYAAY